MIGIYPNDPTEEPKEFECNVCGCEIDKPGICNSNSCFQADIL